MSHQESRTGDVRLDELADAIDRHFAGSDFETCIGFAEVELVVPAVRLREVALLLRDHDDFRFEQLIDVCGVDYAAYGCSEWATEEASNAGFGRGVERGFEIEQDHSMRFASVYQLMSIAYNRRMRLKVFLDASRPIVDSVVDIWSSANWFERESFDLFGILYQGHPDLRRILTDYGFVGHPFRKDFPISGHVEMRYDPDQQRVIYEPVSIEPRTLVPRVIRSDSRYADGTASQTDSPDA